MEAILLETMFDLPGLDGVQEVVISADVVEGNARPLYIYSRARGEEHHRPAASAVMPARPVPHRRLPPAVLTPAVPRLPPSWQRQWSASTPDHSRQLRLRPCEA